MTPAEYETLTTQLATAAGKLLEYEKLQEEIERVTDAKGTVTQVNFVTGVGVIAVRDADMISKAEIALDKLIATRAAEQASI